MYAEAYKLRKKSAATCLIDKGHMYIVRNDIAIFPISFKLPKMRPEYDYSMGKTLKSNQYREGRTEYERYRIIYQTNTVDIDDG